MSNSRIKSDLANMLIIKTVPLAITEGFDVGIVVTASSAPRMDHNREQFKCQQTLRIQKKRR